MNAIGVVTSPPHTHFSHPHSHFEVQLHNSVDRNGGNEVIKPMPCNGRRTNERRNKSITHVITSFYLINNKPRNIENRVSALILLYGHHFNQAAAAEAEVAVANSQSSVPIDCEQTMHLRIAHDFIFNRVLFCTFSSSFNLPSCGA